MMKIKNLWVTVVTLFVLVIGTATYVSADQATDLSSLKVYAVDAAGNKTEVKMNFNSTTYTYNLTVLSTTEKIQIEAVPADSTSKAVVEKEWANTKMDTGRNLTEVSVTSTSGAVQKYTLNTTKLTAEEDAAYKAENGDAANTTDKPKTDGSSKETTVKVGKKKMKISSSFTKADIPDGFKKTTEKYNDKKYTCIKGEVKKITAFYLYNDNTKGFYIYDKDKDVFYPMYNIKIKSRMYTIVKPKETDGILKNYVKKKITIVDNEVNAWALDEEQGMYLVYAMNWNGETNLYCYDDNEKCFQRYLVSNDANNQSEAAAKAYNNLEKDHNKLVEKYNILLKVMCGLAIVIIILIFLCINIGLNKKEKRIKKEKDINYKPDAEDTKEESPKKKKKKSKKEKKAEEDDIDNIDSEETLEKIEEPLEEMEETVEELVPENVQEDSDEAPTFNLESDEFTPEDEEDSSKFFGKDVMTRTYGDQPTFGSDLESNEGFYGGEDDEDGEVFIDITDDETVEEVPDNAEENQEGAPETISKEEKIENDIKAAQKETEEDLKETLKSMLADDEEEEDDDDFEFIDIN